MGSLKTNFSLMAVSIAIGSMMIAPAQADEIQEQTSNAFFQGFQNFFGFYGGPIGNGQIRAGDSRTPILTAESDALPGTSRMEVVRDSTGSMTALNYLAAEGGSYTYTLAQLRQKPQVIKKLDDHDVILVGVDSDFVPNKGGHVTMRYLVNGVTGKYLNFRIALDSHGEAIVLRSDPNPKDPDSDGNSYTSVFNYLFMKKNTVLGKVVGIDEVKPAMK